MGDGMCDGGHLLTADPRWDEPCCCRPWLGRRCCPSHGLEPLPPHTPPTQGSDVAEASA